MHSGGLIVAVAALVIIAVAIVAVIAARRMLLRKVPVVSTEAPEMSEPSLTAAQSSAGVAETAPNDDGDITVMLRRQA